MICPRKPPIAALLAPSYRTRAQAGAKIQTAVRVNTRVTPQEFRGLDLPEDRQWELHEGEIVEMTSPTWIHRALQDRIADRLKAILPRNRYRVLVEMPFEPGNNERSADVGVVSIGREQGASISGVLLGAPEMVVEVWSKSNPKPELAAYKKLCFDHGTLLFWLIEPDERSVTVSLRDEPSTVTFERDDLIPLDPLVDSRLPVSEIFEGIV